MMQTSPSISAKASQTGAPPKPWMLMYSQ